MVASSAAGVIVTNRLIKWRMRCKTLFLEGILSSFLCNVREGETQRVYNRIICQYYIYIYYIHIYIVILWKPERDREWKQREGRVRRERLQMKAMHIRMNAMQILTYHFYIFGYNLYLRPSFPAFWHII